MEIRILHVNINGGNYYKALTAFLRQANEDIICLQEVTGANTFIGNIYSTRDVFEGIRSLLSEQYKGELAISQRFTSNKETSYFGNAIFYRKEFSLKEKQTVSLYGNALYLPSDTKEYKEIGRNLLHLALQKERKHFHILTTHLSWHNRPTEHTYQREQNLKLISYVRKLPHPFLFTGDLNLTANQPTPKELEKYAISLTKLYHIKNTLDPLNHRVKSLFPPGLAVDYIYMSKGVVVKDFIVHEDNHISDHYGLSATVCI